MRWIASFVFVLMVFLFPPRSLAQAPTGENLLQECRLATKDPNQIPKGDWVRASHCLGYLSGVVDSYIFWNAANKRFSANLSAPACIPNEATTDEIARVVVKYLDDHPNKLHEEYSILVLSALADAYPCKKK